MAAEDTTMWFRFGDEEFSVEILEELDAERSPFTRKKLRRLEVEGHTCGDRGRERLIEILKASAKSPLEEIDADSNVRGFWVASTPSYSYSDQSPLTQFTFEIKEHE